MVVLACRPAADRPIKGVVLATMNTRAAAIVRARGRSTGSADRVASVVAQRGQRAVPPGGRGGMSWRRSQCGHATVSTSSGPVPDAHFETRTLPVVVSIWMIQNADTSSRLTVATRPVPGAKRYQAVYVTSAGPTFPTYAKRMRIDLKTPAGTVT